MTQSLTPKIINTQVENENGMLNKIVLVTTYPKAEEIGRIEAEALAAERDFKLVNLADFRFRVVGNKLVVDKIDVEALRGSVVVVRGIFNAIRSVASVVDYLRGNGIPVFDNNLTEHKYVINKVADLVKLAVKGVPVPDAFYTRDFNDYPKYGEQLGYPLIVKSNRMGKGAGVFKLDSKEELEAFVLNLLETDRSAKNYIIQEYVPYKYDLRVLIVGDKTWAMRRIPREGDFRANFSLGGSVEKFELNKEQSSLAFRALEAVNMPVAGVDILVGEDGRNYVLEVNHTAGLVGMEQATGENVVKKYLEVAIKAAK